MKKNNIYLILFMMFVTVSCQTLKNAVSGTRQENSDEFLVQKKDPLILPPNFENLPTPSDRAAAKKELSSFEKKLKKTSSTESFSSESGSTEDSILKQIRRQ